MTKELRITAGLQHAVTQVVDWIQEVNDHRAAVLSALRMELKDVAAVRGIVIAGRTPADREDARALRRSFSGDVELFTYDDLLRDVAEIIRQVPTA
ncbi:MAG TPA: Shedu anti-phage system protein SduA domain-containing protein [Candidatus Acidoferrum sp.]